MAVILCYFSSFELRKSFLLQDENFSEPGLEPGDWREQEGTAEVWEGDCGLGGGHSFSWQKGAITGAGKRTTGLQVSGCRLKVNSFNYKFLNSPLCGVCRFYPCFNLVGSRQQQVSKMEEVFKVQDDFLLVSTGGGGAGSRKEGLVEVEQ